MKLTYWVLHLAFSSSCCMHWYNFSFPFNNKCTDQVSNMHKIVPVEDCAFFSFYINFFIFAVVDTIAIFTWHKYLGSMKLVSGPCCNMKWSLNMWIKDIKLHCTLLLSVPSINRQLCHSSLIFRSEGNLFPEPNWQLSLVMIGLPNLFICCCIWKLLFLVLFGL